LAVFLSSKYPANYLIDLLSDKIEFDFYTKNVFMKFFMLLFSIILIRAMGTFKEFGFQKSKDLKFLKFFLVSLGIIIGAFIFGNILFNGILRFALGFGMPEKTFPPTSILTNILTVWIWSSLCEEVLTRGLVQSLMQKHKGLRFLRLSLPVWISGLFFGAMHLSLLKADMDGLFVGFIVFNTTVIGILAGYYREKSGSLIPAIIVHVLANIVGSLPAMILAAMK